MPTLTTLRRFNSAQNPPIQPPLRELVVESAFGLLVLEKIYRPATRYHCLPASGRCRAAMWRLGSLAARGHRRGVGDAELCQTVEVMLPLRVAGLAQLAQVRPGVKTGVVPVVEPEPHGVVADRFYRGDCNLVLSELQGLLPRAVAAHLS